MSEKRPYAGYFTFYLMLSFTDGTNTVVQQDCKYANGDELQELVDNMVGDVIEFYHRHYNLNVNTVAFITKNQYSNYKNMITGIGGPFFKKS